MTLSDTFLASFFSFSSATADSISIEFLLLTSCKKAFCLFVPNASIWSARLRSKNPGIRRPLDHPSQLFCCHARKRIETRKYDCLCRLCDISAGELVTASPVYVCWVLRLSPLSEVLPVVGPQLRDFAAAMRAYAKLTGVKGMMSVTWLQLLSRLVH